MFRYLLLSFALLTNSFFVQTAPVNRPDLSLNQSALQRPSSFDPNYKLTLSNPVQDKNFYLLSLFQRHPELGKLLRRNPVLRKLTNDKLRALRMAVGCDDVVCFDRLFRLDGPTIEAVANQLRALSRHREFKQLVTRDMRPSGVFIKYRDRTDAEMMVGAWRDAANGMNRLLHVYGLGKDVL